MLIIWPASLGMDELAGASVRLSPLRYALALMSVLLALLFGRGKRVCEKSG